MLPLGNVYMIDRRKSIMCARGLYQHIYAATRGVADVYVKDGRATRNGFAMCYNADPQRYMHRTLQLQHRASSTDVSLHNLEWHSTPISLHSSIMHKKQCEAGARG